MVDNYRATITYTWGEDSWAENFYQPNNLRADVMTSAKAYVQARQISLTAYASAKYIRVSNVDNLRDADFFQYNGFTGQGNFLNPADIVQGDETSQAAVNFRLFSGPTKWRSMLFRGLPQLAIDHRAGNATIDPGFGLLLRTAVNQLINDKWCIRGSIRGAAIPITGMTSLNGRLLTITMSALVIPPSAGDVIAIAGVQGVANMNGKWRVRRVTVPAGGADIVIQVYPKTRLNQGTIAGGTGEFRVQTYDYNAITNGVIIGPTSRKVGKNPYQPRGRRSVQRA